jgi:protein-S-isoprenylcysteine O-methyltransferase Ste14
MKRHLTVGYGVACYLVFVVAFLYAIAFLCDFAVPHTVDSAIAAPTAAAAIVDLVLLSVFAAQHSVMARPAFKAWWTQYVPKAIERSTYVLLSSLALFLLYWQWRSMPSVVWDVKSAAGRFILWTLFWVGWVTAFTATFMIDHFDLFGLRQVYRAWRRQPQPVNEFRAVMLYRLVRHPIMLGFIVAFWATPKMTAGHLLFAGVSTAYILVAIQFEERNLVAALGDRYVHYRKHVSMLLPLPRHGMHVTPGARHRAAH